MMCLLVCGLSWRKACDSDCDHDAVCLDVNNTVVCPPNLHASGFVYSRSNR